MYMRQCTISSLVRVMAWYLKPYPAQIVTYCQMDIYMRMRRHFGMCSKWHHTTRGLAYGDMPSRPGGLVVMFPSLCNAILNTCASLLVYVFILYQFNIFNCLGGIFWGRQCRRTWPLSFRITSLALKQSCYCPRTGEATLKDTDK